MKFFFLLFLLLLSKVSFGQFSNELEAFRKERDTVVSLPKQFKQETIQTKQRFLRREYNDTNSQLCRGKLYAENFTEFANRYDTALYVHDFDHDGDYDILFFSRLCPGYENHDVIIYFKNGKEYIPQHLGHWLIHMKLTRKTTELAVLKTACCADHIMEYMYYESSKDVKDSIRQYGHQVFGLDYFSDTIPKADTSLIITSKLMMMDRPDLNEEDLELYRQIGRNDTIGFLQPGMKVKTYNSFQFDGKTWYYIIVNVGPKFVLTEQWSESYFGEIKAARGWICLE